MRRRGLIFLACAALAAVAVTGVAMARAVTKVAIKPPLVGLLDKSAAGPYRLGIPFGPAQPAELGRAAGAFTGILVNESWATLEPSPGHFALGALQRSLDAVSSYNHTHRRTPLRVRLRIFAGFAAPGWVKALSGGPVSFATAAHTGTTGRWWTAAYRSAWTALQHHLAATYDDDPLVASVAVSSCATLSAEPMVMSPAPGLIREMIADGWSSQAQERCLQGAFADYSGWAHTPIEFAFNPFQSQRSAGAVALSPDFTVTEKLMTTCAELLSRSHRQCVLSNHALDATSATTGRGAPVYAAFDALYDRLHGHVEVALQTNSPSTFGGCAAVDLAVAHHASSLEVWPPSPVFKGFAAFSPGSLYNWARALRTGRRISC